MKNIIYIILVLILLSGCKSTNRKKNFAMMEEQKELLEEIIGDDSTPKPIYITGTKPVWEAESNKLIFDIYRIKTDYYPDSIVFHARVYDSSGNFITNLANPYKRHQDIEYFTALNEKLGKHYNIRDVNIKVLMKLKISFGNIRKNLNKNWPILLPPPEII